MSISFAARRRALTRKARPLLGALVLSGLLTACATPQGGLTQPVLTPVTPSNMSLRSLPPPERKVLAAVYSLEDLTGQFKERDTVQTLSRAVTQGAAPMLIKALQDAGQRQWFTVLERASLEDLLRERRILTEMRRIYENDQTTSADELPPLVYAPILISGGIVGFDTNSMTGGVGARFLGIGGNTDYRQDTVTVALRAVSTKTGEVLASITTHKTIASYGLQGGLFRYIEIDELLEAEAGISANEPGQLAVQQAIEKAVHALVIEGAELGVWAFADAAAGAQLIADYRALKFNADETLQALSAQTAPTAVSTYDPIALEQLDPGPVR